MDFLKKPIFFEETLKIFQIVERGKVAVHNKSVFVKMFLPAII